MLSETCFEIDFNFSDVLSNIGDCRSVTGSKNTNPNGNLNSFNFSFPVDSADKYKSTTDIENDDLDDDLSALLESCHVQKHQPSGITSLSSLANDYLSNNLTSEKKHEKSPLSSIGTSVINGVSEEIQLLDCLEDILFDAKCDNHNRISCSENQLNILQWEQTSVNDCKISELNGILEPDNKTVDDEIIPDIDLNFCIKKNIKDKFSPMSTSPESLDSGFDEIDFSSEKSDTCSSVETSSLEATFGKSNLIKPTLIGSKQSLLSRAISAKPRTGKSRKEKLQNIRKELLKKCVTKALFEHNQDQHQEIFENIVDQSGQCVIKSSFLTIPGQ